MTPSPRITAIAAVLACLLVLEIRRRRVAVLAAVVGLVLADALLYPEVGEAGGVFRVPVPGGSIGLGTVAVLVLAVARVGLGFLRRAAEAGGRPQPAGVPMADGHAVIWAALVVWLTAAGVTGYLAGHPVSNVVYQELGVAEVGGAALLAAGVRPRDWVPRRSLTEALLGLGVVAGLLLAASVTGVSVRWASALLPAAGLGSVGGDAASILGLLGLGAGAAAALLAAGQRRPLLLAAALLCAVPLASSQRAALLGTLAGLVATAAVLALAQRSRRRWLTRRRLAGLLLAALLVGSAGVSFELQAQPGSPSVSALWSRYNGVAKQQSTRSRLNQWTAAQALWEQSPWFGHGLATPYEHYELGGRQIVRGDITHDVAIDVAVRGGLVGVLLLLTAVLVSLTVAGRTALLRAGPASALALGAGAGLVALLTKGAVESIFEKPRLAVALGLTVGLIQAASAAASRSSSQNHSEHRATGDRPLAAAVPRRG